LTVTFGSALKKRSMQKEVKMRGLVALFFPYVIILNYIAARGYMHTCTGREQGWAKKRPKIQSTNRYFQFLHRKAICECASFS